MTTHVLPSEVEAMKARLGPAVASVATTVRSPEAEAIARQWADYVARRTTWASAPEDLETARDFEARLALMHGVRVGQAAPSTEPESSHGLVTPGDVLAYRKMWDDFVMGTARAALACADAWDAAAAGKTPTTAINTQQFARPPDQTTLKIWADSQRQNADSIVSSWNLYADTPDWQLVVQAGDILRHFQHTVLRVGQYYQPQIVKDCPALTLLAPPSFDLQQQTIARIEGLGILAHGVLQLIGIGASGALDTLGSIGSAATKVVTDVSSAVGAFASPLPWIAIAAVAAVVLLGRR
jgi:hypothetical protein